MPESVTDRPTKAHEYLFLLSKSARYFYDADAVREEGQDWTTGGPGTGIADTSERYGAGNGANGGLSKLAQRYKDARGEDGRELGATGERHTFAHPNGRNRRSVWTVATQPYAGAHFATFPPKLIEPCILAGTSPKCCGECGAPWRRVVEAEPNPGGINGRPGVAYSKGTPETTVGNGEKIAGRHVWRHAVTTGWESTCDHDDDTGRSVVLDPFAGAGTAGVVAGQLGRDFVGVELNPEYADLARQRITAEGRPGNREHRPHKPITGQGTLDLLEDAPT